MSALAGDPSSRRGPSRRSLAVAVLLVAVVFAPVSAPGFSALLSPPAPAAVAPTGLTGLPSADAGPRTVAAVPVPAAGHVNPFQLLTSEPAPMGVGDFGVTGATGNVQAYAYATPVFQGNVEVDSMLTSISGSSQHWMTFQLNVVVVYTLGGTNYSYWIQDIASVESSLRYTGWIDNIWNLSGSSAGFALSGELSGNGTVNSASGSVWYADSPGTNYPGSGVTLSWPRNITIRAVSSTINGYPHVGFEYDDGYGWVTFDNVTFEHMRYAVNHGFVVDGYQYTPLGIFYDAEWDYAGSGYGQHNVESELNMSLDYWNGHNLEAVPNAFNFGSDTAESLDNVIAGLLPTPPGGQLLSHLTNGSGTLGLLYNRSSVAVVHVLTPTVAAGTVEVDGSPTAFTGHEANLTLVPGTYNLSLLEGTTPVDHQNVTLPAGSETTVTIPFPRYPVSFVESGLPNGTAWSVSVGSNVTASVGPTATLLAENGTFAFRVLPVPGYVANVTAGTLTVQGAPVRVGVAFTQFDFTVYFTQAGLPAGTAWSVVLPTNTSTFSGATGSLSLPNGTYNYSLVTANAYIGSPVGGNFTVNGSDVGVDVAFVIHLGDIDGALSPASAVLTVDGGAVPVSSAGRFNLSEAAGTYELVATASGYAPAYLNLTVTPGNVSWANLTLSGLPPPPSSPASGSGSPFGGATLWIVVAVVGAAAVLVGALALRARRRRE